MSTVPIDTLIERDSKGLYVKALRGEVENVYGIDMVFEDPKCPNIKVVNDDSKTPHEICNCIIKYINETNNI